MSLLYPTYTDILDEVNKDVPEGGEPIINSRYSVVLAAAKRARQIIDAENNDEIYIDPGEKALSQAVEEIYTDKVKILPSEE